MVVTHTDLSEVSGGRKQRGEMSSSKEGRKTRERTRDGTCRSWSCGGAVLQPVLVLLGAFCAYPHDRDRCEGEEQGRDELKLEGWDELKGREGNERRDVSSVLSGVGESGRHGGSEEAGEGPGEEVSEEVWRWLGLR